MRNINQYIIEKFQVDKDYKQQYAYTPKGTKELIECIREKIDKEGLGTKDKPLDLNDIDTSKITDMSWLFSLDTIYSHIGDLSYFGYFDISDWDVSNVKNMHGMFVKSSFDGDISDWDVSNVEDMNSMFLHSNFTGKNGDISDWNVRCVKDMGYTFAYCPLEKNPPKWYEK